MQTVIAGKRYAFLDLLKWIFTLLIMTHHLYHIGFEYGRYHFTAAYRAVEFFFMVSGFLTVKHFRESAVTDNTDSAAFRAIQYTGKKFTSYLPFTIPPLMIVYFWDWAGLNFSGTVNLAERFAAESAFLGCVFGGIKDIPLWYLSALFIVFPLFCIWVQKSEKYAFLLGAVMISILGYGWLVEYHGPYSNWKDLARALSGVAAGGWLGISQNTSMNRKFS